MSTELHKRADTAAEPSAVAKETVRYLHDRYVLLFLTINLFLALVVILSVLFRLQGSATSGGYIVQYRPSLGISAFKTGSSLALYAFIAFSVLVLGLHTSLSMRAYAIKRYLSVSILAVGSLLLIIAAIVVNALLALD